MKKVIFLVLLSFKSTAYCQEDTLNLNKPSTEEAISYDLTYKELRVLRDVYLIYLKSAYFKVWDTLVRSRVLYYSSSEAKCIEIARIAAKTRVSQYAKWDKLSFPEVVKLCHDLLGDRGAKLATLVLESLTFSDSEAKFNEAEFSIDAVSTRLQIDFCLTRLLGDGAKALSLNCCPHLHFAFFVEVIKLVEVDFSEIIRDPLSEISQLIASNVVAFIRDSNFWKSY